MRSVVINQNGKKYRFPIGAKGEKEAVTELQNQLTWSEKLLMYSCYVNTEVASRTITECMEEFFVRRDVYKHQTKKLANEARKSLYDTMNVILSHGDKEFLDNFSNNMCEEIWPNIDNLRNAIMFELDSVGVKESRLYAYVNTAFAMLEYCTRSYDKLMKELREKFNRDFSPIYTEFCPKDARYKWDLMFTKLFEKDMQDYDINLSASEKCQKAMTEIDDKLLDYDRIRNHVVEAYKELPDEKKTEELNKTILAYEHEIE